MSSLETSGMHPKPGTVITREMVDALPDPAARYLSHAGVVGRPIVGRVSLRQTGRIRSSSDKPWMPITAEETYTVDPPGFNWIGAVRLLWVPVISPHDAYVDGHGRMRVTLAHLIKLWDLAGEEMVKAR